MVTQSIHSSVLALEVTVPRVGVESLGLISTWGLEALIWFLGDLRDDDFLHLYAPIFLHFQHLISL